MKTIGLNIRKAIFLFAVVFNTVSVSATDVGTPNGRFSVSPMGGAVYSVEIEAPAGIKGMQPSIAVTYNSQSGAGIAGYGCNVSGISCITRAPKDAYHDSTAVKGIAFDNTDAFYLDGKRLLLQSGTEGANGAVYSPEGEPFTEVTLHTSTYQSSPTIWFEVKSNDGITYKYGEPIYSTMFVYSGNIMYQNIWYVNRIEDQLGNYMIYYYLSYNYTVYPHQISYGNNSNEGGTSSYVDFIYEDEPNDQHSYYVKGTKVTMSKRLKSITTSHGMSIYRTYDFSYSNMTLGNRTFSALSTITEKNGNNESLNPIILNWNSVVSNSQSTSHPTITLAQSSSYTTIDDRFFFAADLNGDGFSDIIHLSRVRLSNGYGGYSYNTYLYVYRSKLNHSSQTISYLSPIIFVLGPTYDIGDMARKMSSPSILDFDGDGLNDIVIPNMNIIENLGVKYAQYIFILGKDVKSGNTSNIPCFSMPLTSSSMSLYASADVDNDSKSNVVILDRNQVSNVYAMTVIDYGTGSGNVPHIDINLSLPSAPQELFLADFNNNGLNDLMVVYDGGYRIFWNQTGSNVSAPYISSSYTSGTTVSYQSNLDMGDFNGDGSPDILIGEKNSNNWHVAFGKGDGTFQNQSVGTFDIYDQSTSNDDDKMRCLVYDFNGDGRSDVVIEKAVYSGSSFSQTKALWLQSSGTALTLVKTATSQSQDDGRASYYMLGDFSGSGRIELMNYGYNCYSGYNANVSPTLNLYKQSAYTATCGKITSVTDGLGNQTYMSYAFLLNSGKYTPQSNALFPMADVSLPVNIVSQTTQTNGVANSVTLSYEYGGMKAHLRGKGLLGFSESKTTNVVTSDSTKTTVSNWDPQFFVPRNSTAAVYHVGQGESSSSVFTISGKGNHNYFCYLSSKDDVDLYGNTTSLTNQYNTVYGYKTSEKISNGTDMYKKTDYSNYVLKGRVWLPQTVTYSQKHSDDSNVFTDVTSITYNYKGLRTQVIKHQGVTGKSVTTNYSYDNAGNVVSETSQGTGIPNITYYYTYESNLRDLKRTYTSPSTTNIYYTYDNWGNVLTEQDRTNTSNYLTTTYTYDGWGRKATETSPTGVVTNYSIGWGTSQAKKYYTCESPQGRSAHYTWYDACGREVFDSVRVLKGIPQTYTTTYDTKGRVAGTVSSIGQVSRTIGYSYDGWNRVISKTTNYEGNTSYTYGNRTVNSVRNGQSFSKTFDAWGNVKNSIDPVSSVTYTYYSNGKPESITSDGSTVTMEYDGVGNQILLDDPDAGETTYTYDAAGHLLTQTDARNITTQNVYDNLGRLSSVTVDGVATTYTYGNSGNELFRLTKEQRGNNSIDYTHDQYGRLSTVQRTVAGSEVLTYSYSYNSDDLISQVTYPGSVAVSYTYDPYGYRTGMSVNGTNVWSVTTHNGYNVITSLQGRSTTTYVDGAYRVNAKFEGNSRALSFMHSYTTGNLTSRMGVAGETVTENFTYDGIDRLTGVTVPSSSISSFEYLSSVTGESLASLLERFAEPIRRMENSVRAAALSASSIPASMTVCYGANGNIASKTGIGNYTYPNSNAVHPHAVTSVGNSSSLISTAAQSITYNGFGKVASISDNGYAMSFTYGPDMERWKTVLTQNGVTKRTTIYADNYEQITENDTTRQIYYLDDDVVCMKVNNSNPVFYKGWTDNIGSYLQLIDNTGTSVFEAQYDAWGRQEVTKNNVGFHRGYTGHEMLPEFGLINMNGRLYDPLLGRFLSPDNYVQLPDFSQNFNRYSYCLNNPLKYTDPSGEWFGIDDLIASIVGGTINLGVNLLSGNIHSIGQGFASFGLGAAAGELSLYGQVEVSAILVGAGNSIINQGFTNGWNNINWMDAAIAGGMSMAFSAIGGKISSLYSKQIENIFSGISNDVLRNTLSNGTINSITGFAIESGLTLANGGSLSDALDAGLEGAGIGFVTGAINGAAWGIREKARNSNCEYQIEPEILANDMIHNGKFPIAEGPSSNSVYVGTDENGVIRYVGITERDPEIRFKEHYNSGTERAKLRYRIVDNATGLSRIQARIIEQRLINVYGIQKYNGQLYNIINSISPRYWNKYGLINR